MLKRVQHDGKGGARSGAGVAGKKITGGERRVPERVRDDGKNANRAVSAGGLVRLREQALAPRRDPASSKWRPALKEGRNSACRSGPLHYAAAVACDALPRLVSTPSTTAISSSAGTSP